MAPYFSLRQQVTMRLFQKLSCSGSVGYRAALMLLGFSVPVSTALDNVLLFLFFVPWVVVFQRDALRDAYRNPVVKIAALLFGVLLLATCYGEASLGYALNVLGKYIDLAMIPFLMVFVRRDRDRDYAVDGFLLAMILTLILSYLIGFGVLGMHKWMLPGAGITDPMVFRQYNVQNPFMALAIFFAFLRIRETKIYFVRVFLGVFALLAMFNALFMVEGRTGYATLIILSGWFIWTTLARRFSARGKAIGSRHAAIVILLMMFAIVGVYFSSLQFQARVNLIFAEFHAWVPHTNNETSVGARLNFYYTTLQIIRQNPAMGIGMGGLPAVFSEQDKQFHGWVDNPHNEYLMIAVQTGVIGLVLLLYLFYTLWRNALLLSTPFKQDAARGLVLATMIDCLFNSTLLDHAPGLLFALMAATFFANLKTDGKPG